MNEKLRYFVAAAETLNFTKAADGLFITQQALSKAIMRLEHEYGAKLFERGRKLRLTEAGERFLNYARTVLDAEDRLRRSAEESDAASTVRMPVGICSAKGHIILPLILPEFNRQHPKVVISVYEGPANYLDMMLQYGRIDLYMRMKGDEPFFGRFLPLHNDEMFFIISKKLLAATFGDGWRQWLEGCSEGVTAADICRFPLIFPNEGSSLHATLTRYLSGYSPRITAEDNNYYSVFKTVRDGLCGGFESKMFYYDMRSGGGGEDVFALPMRGVSGISQFGIAYDPSAMRKKYVEDFVELAKRQTASIEPQIDALMTKVTPPLSTAEGQWQ